MKIFSLRPRILFSLLTALGLGVFVGAGCGSDSPPPPPADTIFTNATFFTMAPSGASEAQALAVGDGQIVAVGSESEVFAFEGPNTQVVDLGGAFVFPGFIDTHSHTIGYAFFNDPEKWLDVSSVNLYFKPLPGDPRCTEPNNPQKCFIPVTNQDQVLARIQAKVDEDPASSKPVLGYGYANGRLGSTGACSELGFACPNFQGESPNAREALDAISPTRPIAIAASTGHFLFVNTPALAITNICGTDGSDPGTCHSPAYNADYETGLAQTGVLVEDLALYGTGVFQQQILKEDPFATFNLLKKGVEIYAQHGFTTVQEGAAEEFQVEIYDIITQDPDFPVTVQLLAYSGSSNFQDAINTANKGAELAAKNPRIRMAGIKTFADGSVPCYTGALTQPYFEIFPPNPAGFTGIVDLTEADLSTQIAAAHAAGYPIAIHMNGDEGVDNALAAMQANKDPDIIDIAIHLQLSDPEDYQIVKDLDAQVTFLIANNYYFGLPYCQQILGPERVQTAVNPVGDALEAGLPIRLHSDSPVTPPDALFMIWAAVTREAQQMPWYPNQDPTACPSVLAPDQAITIAQGMKAFTIDSAALYGLEEEVGSLEVGKFADLVVLSANPLSMEADPDQLSTIQIQKTVHRGKVYDNPKADDPPIWPD
ncbi:MAG TPA: amidohydrolase [bacterium]|nr:amidohydrolase [bacterium]